MNILKVFAGSVLGAIVLMGCSKEVEDKGPPAEPNPYTKIVFEFTHNVDGTTLEQDTAQYENASGNIFGVENLRYLIGKIRLDSWDNPDPVYIDEYHLVELDDPSTLIFSPRDTILVDDYQNITFFMGFEEENNKTGNYPQLNDKSWGWPPNYGGGYYTLRMEGNYYSSAASTVTNLYNIGIGGNRLKETPTDTSWIPNPIYASVIEGFDIPKGTDIVKVEIRMDVNRLFKSNIGIANFDLDAYGNNLEQNAIGSKILSDNLHHVFRLGSITIDEKIAKE